MTNTQTHTRERGLAYPLWAGVCVCLCVCVSQTTEQTCSERGRVVPVLQPVRRTGVYALTDVCTATEAVVSDLNKPPFEYVEPAVDSNIQPQTTLAASGTMCVHMCTRACELAHVWLRSAPAAAGHCESEAPNHALAVECVEPEFIER